MKVLWDFSGVPNLQSKYRNKSLYKEGHGNLRNTKKPSLAPKFKEIAVLNTGFLTTMVPLGKATKLKAIS